MTLARESSGLDLSLNPKLRKAPGAGGEAMTKRP